MLDGPLQFLDRNQYLSEQGVDLGLTRVKTSYSSDLILIVENVSITSP